MEDLSEAAAFIARDSPFYAKALVRESRTAARSLQSLAERGRVVPECDDLTIRELFVKQYRLIYRFDNLDCIYILAFVHGARDLATLWSQRNG
jgi:plasmid stabilization system protein ParE